MKIPHPFLRSDFLKFSTLQKGHWDNSSRSFLTVATREKGQLPQYFMQFGLCGRTATLSSASVWSLPLPCLPVSPVVQTEPHSCVSLYTGICEYNVPRRVGICLTLAPSVNSVHVSTCLTSALHPRKAAGSEPSIPQYLP